MLLYLPFYLPQKDKIQDTLLHMSRCKEGKSKISFVKLLILNSTSE